MRPPYSVYQKQWVVEALFATGLAGIFSFLILHFGQGRARHVAVELTDENHRQLWVPRGFAVLSESADFFYKCDEFHRPNDEIVVRWNDPAIGVSWGIDHPTLSARDAAAPLLASLDGLPIYGCV